MFYLTRIYFVFQTVWLSVRVHFNLKKIFPCLISCGVCGQGCVFFLSFFSSFFHVWGQRRTVPTEIFCFYPWMWSIMDGTPTAWHAGIVWKKKLGKPSSILPAPERRVGDRTTLGRQLAPAFYSRLLGVTVWRNAQRHAHTRARWQTPLERCWPTPLTTSLICGPKMWKPIEVIINDSS